MGEGGALLLASGFQSEEAALDTSTMNRFISTTLALALVLLTLCTAGQALECYDCTYTNKMCDTKKTCSAGEDSCVQLTVNSQTFYGCKALTRCSTEALKQDMGVTNFEAHCCQKDLCNRSPLALPVTALVLSISMALVMLFSW